MDKLQSTIESILFVSNTPLSLKNIAKAVETDVAEVSEALKKIKEQRKNSGIVLLDANEEYQLATSADNSSKVKEFLNSGLREKLTDATVETLAIIGYRQPISKAEIEAIRGVNSQYSIRILLMRGLIEKVSNPNDARGSYYQITTELLQHLGITSISDLPSFESLVKEIKLPEVPQTKPEEVEPIASGPASPSAEPAIEEPDEKIVLLESSPLPEEAKTAPEKTPTIPQVNFELGDELENTSLSQETDEEDKEDEFEEDDEDEEDEKA